MRILVNGTSLWFDVEGPGLVADGPAMRERLTVVLVHGGPAGWDHSYFKPDFARLAETAQLIYLDLRGHGRSEWGAPDEWTFEVCADDIRAFCDALGITRPVVYGHSFGGAVTMAYGARHPGHAAGLVLQSTYAHFDLTRVVEGFRRVGGDEIAEIAKRVWGSDVSVTREDVARCQNLTGPTVPDEEQVARRIVNKELGPRGSELTDMFDYRDELRKVASPTLVCVGDLDPVTPVSASQEIFEGLREGVGQLEVIEGAGHWPWKDDPDRYFGILVEFLTSTQVGSARGVRDSA